MPRRPPLAFLSLSLACLGLVLLSAAPARAQEIKPLVRGLISMGAYEFVAKGGQPQNTLKPIRSRPGIFGGLVVVASWQQLQPKRNGPLKDNNVIDKTLAHIRVYNANHPQRPLAVKLRVWGGFMAPKWAKKIGGPPIPAMHKNHYRTVGRFWLPEYRAAFARLQTLLAAKYDNEPLIREVAITQCMSFTAEPFFVPGDVFPTLRLVGFNDRDYKDCLSKAIADYAPWQRTRLVYPFNPYSLTGSGQGDMDFTRQVMADCRNAVHERCVLDNHDLDNPPLKPIVPVYEYMQTLGPEIEFQTYNVSPKDFPGTIQLGVTNGASGIELYQLPGGFPSVSAATLKVWATWIEENTGAPKQPPGRN